jgi:hypothetical protein
LHFRKAVQKEIPFVPLFAQFLSSSTESSFCTAKSANGTFYVVPRHYLKIPFALFFAEVQTA